MKTDNHVTFSMILAQLLNQRQEAKYLTQKEFLAESGISQATWSRINRGHSSFSIEDINAACRVLEDRCSELIRKAEEIEAGLPEMDIEVVPPVKPNYAGAFIAGAVLAFLISRLG